MELPQLKREPAEELRTFRDETQRIVRALTNLGMPVRHWDVWLVYILAGRLDPESQKLWETDVSTTDRKIIARAAASESEPSRLERFPEFPDFVEFLELWSQALNMIASETKAHKSSAIHIADRKCPLSSQNHYVGACPTFLAKSPYGRWDDVRRLSLCFNCMGPHKSQRCASKRRCKECAINTIRHYTPPRLGRQQPS